MKKLNKKGAGLRPFTMSIIMIILFSFFIFGFIGNFITATNPTSELLGEKYRLNQSLNSMQENLDDFSTFSESLRTGDETMGGANPTALEYVFLIFKGAFYVPFAFIGFIFTGTTGIVNTLFPIFAGTGMGTLLTVVLDVIFAGIIVTIILLVVKMIRTGEGER
ncbi:MAG: hypothetical protein M0R03_22850 [Novosphingobium sp.]|nr:hypothetical protein [Novosphingobium sp.]